MNLAARSPKQKAEESPRVTFKQEEEDSEDEAKPPPRASKKFKAGKTYKSRMVYDKELDDATKKAWTAAYKAHCKRHPNSMEAKNKQKVDKEEETVGRALESYCGNQ